MSFEGAGDRETIEERHLQGGREGHHPARAGVRRGLPALPAVPVPGDHRPAVEGPPAGDGPPAPGHRPARLRPEGPEAGVQEGGLQRLHPDAGGHQDAVRQPDDAGAGAQHAGGRGDGPASRSRWPSGRSRPSRAGRTRTARSTRSRGRGAQGTARRPRALGWAATIRARAAAAASTRSATAPPRPTCKSTPLPPGEGRGEGSVAQEPRAPATGAAPLRREPGPRRKHFKPSLPGMAARRPKSGEMSSLG